MAVPEITILYAGILGLMAVVLAATCGLYRANAGISHGPGDDEELAMRMRRHANFVENVPLALLLIALLEMQAVSSIAVHALGGAVVLGRGLHWYGFAGGVTSAPRGLGAGITTLAIVVASVWGIVTFFV